MKTSVKMPCDFSMKGEGLISINCTENEKNINILISDTGEGIEKSIQRSIFTWNNFKKERVGTWSFLKQKDYRRTSQRKNFVKKSNKQEGTTFCVILPK